MRNSPNILKIEPETLEPEKPEIIDDHII